MSHNDASESKRIKLTREEDSKRETPIDNGHSVANSKGMLLEQNITNFCLYIIYHRYWFTTNIQIFVFSAQGEKYLMNLPGEIIEKILLNSDLSYKDLKNIRLTSHGLKEIADSAIKKRDRKCKHIYL